MIQVQTLLKVSDNSGAKQVRCIKVIGGSKKKYATVGQIIKASVVDIGPKSKIKRGQVVNAIVIRVAKFFRHHDYCIKFDHSAVSILNSSFDPVASRIFGPIPEEFRN